MPLFDQIERQIIREYYSGKRKRNIIVDRYEYKKGLKELDDQLQAIAGRASTFIDSILTALTRRSNPQR